MNTLLAIAVHTQKHEVASARIGQKNTSNSSGTPTSAYCFLCGWINSSENESDYWLWAIPAHKKCRSANAGSAPNVGLSQNMSLFWSHGWLCRNSNILRFCDFWSRKSCDPETPGFLTKRRCFHLASLMFFRHRWRARSRKVSTKAFSFSPSAWNFWPVRSQGVRKHGCSGSIPMGQNNFLSGESWGRQTGRSGRKSLGEPVQGDGRTTLPPDPNRLKDTPW